MMNRISWAVWAIAPVFLLAYHFGPGQQAAELDQAHRMHQAALELERGALDVQADAHRTHLEALEARRRAFLSDSEADHAAAEAASEAEQAAYALAADAWRDAADAYEVMEPLVEETDHAADVAWAKARALVRAGQIFNGIDELEILLEEAPEGSELALRTRQELAAAHYYGARILRLEGEPAETWRAVSGKARQHYRFLAEQAEEQGEGAFALDMQRNVELVLDLEQQDNSEVLARALPKQSPSGQCSGDRPCNAKRKNKRPPQRRDDGRGAGGAGEIGAGH